MQDNKDKNYIELQKSLMNKMLRIRKVEEEIAKRYPQGKMRCPTHLSVGQEAVAAAFGECIKTSDYAVSTHRGHGHYLSKGGCLKSMLAELYGKETGCSKGRGGSMHLVDLRVNFMGTSAIVGNSIPIGVGLALSAKIRKTKQVSCVFIGDGAIEEGVFYESVNFAALRKLPVVFICENNLYSVYSPIHVRQPENRCIAKMVEGMGIEATKGNGNDAMECYGILKNTINECRAKSLPQFLEFSTYRLLEHCGTNYDDYLGYRKFEEIKEWRHKDPIQSCKKILDDKGINTAEYESGIMPGIIEEINKAFSFAEESPFPELESLMEGIYA